MKALSALAILGKLGTLLSIMFMASCATEKTDELPKEAIEQRKIAREAKEEVAGRYAAQDGAVLMLDTFSSVYSLNYEPYLERNVFAQSIEIHDVFGKDGETYISIYLKNFVNLNRTDIFLELKVDSAYATEITNMTMDMQSQMNSGGLFFTESETYMATIRIAEIRKYGMHFTTALEDAGNDYDNPTVTIENNPSNSYYGKGNLVRLYTFEE